MNTLRTLLGQQLLGDVMAAKVAQIACYVIALVVFVVAILKLTSFTLTEAELFFGILQIVAVFGLMICAGTLVRIEAELRRRREVSD